jgi:hypothetical protein
VAIDLRLEVNHLNHIAAYLLASEQFCNYMTM